MSEIRTMKLYRLDHNGRGVYIASREYVYTTQAYERQTADDLVVEKGEAGDQYYVAVVDNEGNCINKLSTYR